MRQVKRNGIVDFMRLCFCMVIVIFHGRNLGGTSQIALFREAGYIGVEFFFLVSGFLMAKSAAKRQEDCARIGPETIKFIWNKIKPMLAYYVFAVILSYGRTIYVEAMPANVAFRNFFYGVWDLCFLRASGIKTYGLVRATWYISAMLLAMLVLYPMLRKWKATFTHIIAPVIAVFFLGYLSQNFGNLNQYVKDFRLIYTGVMRALAELSLGCICYEVCEKMKGVRYTAFSRVLLTLAEVVGYGSVILCATQLPVKQFDFVMLLILAVSVTISFSGQGISAPLFQGKIFAWFGKLSLCIYLNHMAVKDAVAEFHPKAWGYKKLMCIYVFGVILVSLLCMLWEMGLQKFWGKFGPRIRRLFVKQISA